MPSIFVPLWPFDERHQLEYGDPVGEKDVRRLLRFYRRAAAVVPRLIADGWELCFVRCAVQGEHEDAKSVEEIRARLAALDIPSGWVEISGGVEPERPTDD